MRKYLLLSFLLSALFSTSQISSINVKIINDLPNRSQTGLQQGGKIVHRDCLPDTLAYGRYKAAGYRALTISDGFKLGQFYESPDTITYSGFQFYAWQSDGTDQKVDVVCNMYLAGSDSMPTGTALRSTTITIDSTFGGGVLTNLMKRVNFSTSYTTNLPVVFTVESSDTVRVAVVSNDFGQTPPDGEMENLMCGTVANTWYRGLNLNVGGATLDCDMVFEPYVKYKIYNDFSITDCYKYVDSLIMPNKSSPLFTSKMYNLYAFYDIAYINHRWNYGHNTGNYATKDGRIKYTTPGNYNVRLVSSMYGITVRPTCIDTVQYKLTYQPSRVGIIADTPVCSGNTATITAIADAPLVWYKKPGNTDSFYNGKQYTTSSLNSSVSYYLESKNEHCKSGISKVTIPVYETPSDPTVSNDSVCLNAKADLYATAPVGEVRWFATQTDKTALDTGNFFQTPNLNKDKSYWVEVFNNKCSNGKRTEVIANVNANNAPDAPIISSDTTLCLQQDSVQLTPKISGSNTVRWFNLPGDKTPFHTGNSLKLPGNKPSTAIIFVDAFDGQCASSKSNILLKVKSFPTLTSDLVDSVCSGKDLLSNLSLTAGSARWFDSKTGGNDFHSGTDYSFSQVSANRTVYVEPFEGECEDTVRHALEIVATPLPTLGAISGDKQVCKGSSTLLSTSVDFGNVIWANNPDFIQGEISNSFRLLDIQNNGTYFVAGENEGCFSAPTQLDITALDVPTARFDYQVNAPGELDFTSKQGSANLYEWDFGDGKSATGKSVSHTFTKNGDFKVIAIVGLTNGCRDTASSVLTIGGVVSGVEEPGKIVVQVFPNPFEDVLYINAEHKITSAILYNSLGQVIPSKIVYSNHSAHLNINDTPIGIIASNGFYYLEVQLDNGNTTTVKLMK